MRSPLSGADRSRLSALTLEPRLASAGWQMAFLGDGDDEPDTVFHPGLNAALSAGSQIQFTISEDSYQPDDPWMVEKRVAEMTASGKVVFDSPKIRLCADPVPGAAVGLEKTTYFNGLTTNEFCLKTYKPCDNLLIDGTERAFPMSMVPKLSRSRMSNHIGAASIAFDDEGVICLCVTGGAAAVSAGKISASAAGSIDEDDIVGATSLTGAIADTISRELAEETGLDPRTSVRTRVIAFARDLTRGGKPEFLAVSRVKGNWAEIVGELGEDERNFTAGHLMLDAKAMGIDGVSSWMIENSGRTSYALRSAWEFFCREHARPTSVLPAMLGFWG